MRKLFYFIATIIAIHITGCQEEEALIFQDAARIQFTSNDDLPYSFIWLDKSQEQATVKLPLRVIGGPQNTEREVKVSQIEEFDITYEYDNKGYVIDSVVTPVGNPALPGTHYVTFDNPEAQALLKVAPGVVQDSLAIILKRDASLSSGKVRLRVRLEASDDFLLGESKYLERTIIFSDMLEQPSGWYYRSYYDKSTAYSYLGNYSVPKHELMVRVLQRLQGKDSRVDDEWIAKGNADPTIFVYWRSKFVEELNAFNSDPDNIASGVAPLREDPTNSNSTLVTFPTKVQ
ncbi:MAG: DUF4843 domain-containing protein [Bacteroides sp.]|nr:DUF4843 domain-containing protein [Bacteroides sp.]